MLDGQVALVTGASRGIGQAIAFELGRRGARVIGTATSENGAKSIGDYLKQQQIEGRGAVLDVADADSVSSVVADVTAIEGAITILVNNAGITRDNLLLRMKPEEWDDVLNTNLSALFRTCKSCLRGMMKARYGRIINISSVVGLMGNPGQTNYAAAK
ncbi:MAG: SDR family NAD(P)-dependent oxidoreductase, partial [Gammaproteobacteria bacterium]